MEVPVESEREEMWMWVEIVEGAYSGMITPEYRG